MLAMARVEDGIRETLLTVPAAYPLEGVEVLMLDETGKEAGPGNPCSSD